MPRRLHALHTWIRQLPLRLKGLLLRLDKLAIILLYLCLLVLLPSIVLKWEAGIRVAIALGLFFAANFLAAGALDFGLGRHQQAVRRLRGQLEATSTSLRPVAGDRELDRRAILHSSVIGEDGQRRDYLNFVANGELAGPAELFPARVVIPNSGAQDKHARVGDDDAAPYTEGVAGLRLSLTVSPDASGRRLWLDQARAGSVEAGRAILIDGAADPDYGQFNYIIISTVNGDLRQPRYSNALLTHLVKKERAVARQINSLRLAWERRARETAGQSAASPSSPSFGIFAIRSPFQTAWESGRVVVVAVAATEQDLAAGLAGLFRAKAPANRIDITVTHRTRWQQFQQTATDRVPGVVAAAITIGSMLIRSFFPGAILALFGNLTLYARLTALNATAVGAGLLVGVGWHTIQDYGRLRDLFASAGVVYDDLAARAFASGVTRPPAVSDAWMNGNQAANSVTPADTIGAFLAGLDPASPPLIVSGHNFHFPTGEAEGAAPRNLLGMPIRIDTIDLVFAAELLTALDLDRDENCFRLARPGSLHGDGDRKLCLSQSELMQRDLIILGSPRANALSDCLFRCGVDYDTIHWGFRPVGQCPRAEGCALRAALTALADGSGRALLAPWVFEPEQVTAYANGERVRSFGFPWHENAGLLQLVANPFAADRRILLIHGYHRAGSDAAVRAAITALRGEGLPELATAASAVVELSAKERRVECLYTA